MLFEILQHLPTSHCAVIGFALDWESHKSLKHDHECLTELLERVFFQPYAVLQFQLLDLAGFSSKGQRRRYHQRRDVPPA